jgi:hypothetical protein
MIAPEDGSASEIRPVEATQNEGPQDIGVEAEEREEEERDEGIQFNPYAMVLSELTQEELSGIAEEEIRAAIDEGTEAAQVHNPSRSSAVQVAEAVRLALRAIRSN